MPEAPRPPAPSNAPPPPPQPQRQPSSVIGPDLTITGNVECRGAIQVNGVINGDVSCDTLSVGEDGTVTGNVSAGSVRISGTVNGQVKAKEVIIARTAKMLGDVLHESLTVEQGAVLEGHCARLKSDVETRPGQRAAAPTGNGAGKPPETAKTELPPSGSATVKPSENRA